MTDSVEMFTDGACKGNPGPGGWGALLVCQGVEKELWGGEPNTTNNRMELMAAIRGLEELKRPCEVLLVTDSQYVMKGITEWMVNWKKRGWKTASKEPVKNADLWKLLDELERRRARVDVYKALGLHKRRRTGADALLVIIMEIAALIER